MSRINWTLAMKPTINAPTNANAPDVAANMASPKDAAAPDAIIGCVFARKRSPETTIAREATKGVML